MIRIILHLVLINQVFGSIFDTYLYREGNRGCLGEVVLAYRFNSSSECSPSCQTLSSGQALPINGRFQCPLKWTEPFRLTGSKRFVKFEAFNSTSATSSCDQENLQSYAALLADKSCFQWGSNFYRAYCERGGNAGWETCVDAKCTDCATTLSLPDGVCRGNIRLTCINPPAPPVQSSATISLSSALVTPSVATRPVVPATSMVSISATRTAWVRVTKTLECSTPVAVPVVTATLTMTANYTRESQ